MRVYGIDFTSTPSARKPLRCAMCRCEGAQLLLDGLCDFDNLETFRNFLASAGPWVAGLDFPFGLPRDTLSPLSWEADWSRYVRAAAAMGREEFRALVRTLASEAEPGRRYSKRRADRVAHAQSPLNVTRPPVGLMFHAGAPALLESDVTAVPVRDGDPDRLVIEAYPKLVAEALIGRRSYKDEPRAEPGEPRTEARAELVQALAGATLARSYGMTLVGLDSALATELTDESAGDRVDALMCAIQAAWAWRHRAQGYGVPDDVDPVEGWIVDPATRLSAD